MDKVKEFKNEYYVKGNLKDFSVIFEEILLKTNDNIVKYLNTTIKEYREKDRIKAYKNEPITIEDFSVYKNHDMSLFELLEKYNPSCYKGICQTPFIFYKIEIARIFRYLWASSHIESTELNASIVFYKTNEEFFMLLTFTSDHTESLWSHGSYMKINSMSTTVDMPRIEKKDSSDRNNELDNDTFSTGSYLKFWHDVITTCAGPEYAKELMNELLYGGNIADIMDINVFVVCKGVVVFHYRNTSSWMAVTPYGFFKLNIRQQHSYYKKFKKHLWGVSTIEEITLQRLLWWFGIETDLRGNRKIFNTSICNIDWNNENIKDLFITKCFSS